MGSSILNTATSWSFLQVNKIMQDVFYRQGYNPVIKLWDGTWHPGKKKKKTSCRTWKKFMCQLDFIVSIRPWLGKTTAMSSRDDLVTQYNPQFHFRTTFYTVHYKSLGQNVNMDGILLGGSLARISSMIWYTLPSAQWCGKKVVPPWNCSQKGLWIILGNWVMIPGKTHCCWCFISKLLSL